MARIRTIKPDFWTDSLMVQLPHLTRLFYIALWNAADDHGFVRDEPERLAMELMPREDPLDVDAAIQALAAAGRLEWYVCEDGTSYYRVAKWEDHQRVDHPATSKVARDDSRKLAIPQEARRAVAEKYGCAPGKQREAACFYCGQAGQVYWFKLRDGRPSAWVVFPGLELDHLEAEAEGGQGEAHNLVLSCRRCNRGKGTRHWFDFLTSRAFANPREVSLAVAPERKGKERKGTVSSSSRDDGAFVLFWTSYPRKVGKGAALARWGRLTAADRTAAIEAVPRFAAAQNARPREDHRYCPHPATWLSERRWEDDPGEWTGSAPDAADAVKRQGLRRQEGAA